MNCFMLKFFPHTKLLSLYVNCINWPETTISKTLNIWYNPIRKGWNKWRAIEAGRDLSSWSLVS